MSLRVLSARDVERVVASWPPDRIIAIIAQVFAGLSSQRTAITTPHRTAIAMAKHIALFMPSRIEGTGTTIKVVSVPTTAGDTGGLPGSTMVLDETTGAAKAIVNARSLTALRTAAGSVLATVLLHPPISSQPAHLVAFGAGKQIQAHVDLLLATYLSLAKVTIVNRTLNERLSSLLSYFHARHPSIQFSTVASSDGGASTGLQDAVASADFICTATSSTAALFPSAWVCPGTHLILVGSYTPAMAEVDTALIRRCRRVVVDSREACLLEAGELITAGCSAEDTAEVGELIHVGSVSPDGGWKSNEAECERVRQAGDVTIFKSVGVGAQDVAIACAVVERAVEHGMGSVVEAYDA